MKEKIKDIHLLLLFLTSWEEDSRSKPGEKIRRSWKGYDFKTLDELQDEKYIIQLGLKSLMLTNNGIQKARELQTRYCPAQP